MMQSTLEEAAAGTVRKGEIQRQQRENWNRVGHTAGGAEASFDCTKFESASRFQDVLDELELPTDPEEVVKFESSDGTSSRSVWVWANDEVALIT